ncbi:MAG TPA: TonB family protein [Verrucomicrobiae bacterium]|nr:TonB family protein [Verrucomicrobiae bacterium]
MIFDNKIEGLLSAIAVGVASGAIGSILTLTDYHPPVVCFQIGDIGIDPGPGLDTLPTPPPKPPNPIGSRITQCIPAPTITIRIAPPPSLKVISIASNPDLEASIALSPCPKSNPPQVPPPTTNSTNLAENQPTTAPIHDPTTTAMATPSERAGSPSGASQNHGGSLGGIRGAQPLASIFPTYPEISRHKGEEGTVELAFVVLPSGKTANIVLARSSGFPLLDDAAIQAVRRARFKPAIQNGVPVNSKLLQPFDFRLR